LVIGDLLDDRNLPRRRLVVRVVPGEDEPVAGGDRVAADLRLAVETFAVRNVGARAVAAVAPAVERTLDAAVDDLAAYAEMRAEVRAVRIEQVVVGVLIAPQHEIAPEVA